MYAGAGRLAQDAAWPLRRHGYLLVESCVGLALRGICFALGWTDFPEEWDLSLATPVDALVKWAQVNLYEIGDTGLGTGPLSDFISLYILAPLRKLFMEIIPWPALMLLVAAAALAIWPAGLALACALSMIFIGLLGMWEASIDTVTQVLVAVVHDRGHRRAARHLGGAAMPRSSASCARSWTFCRRSRPSSTSCR